VTDAKRALTSLRRLGLSDLLVSPPFGILQLGLPLIARQSGAGALASRRDHQSRFDQILERQYLDQPVCHCAGPFTGSAGEGGDC
jgi:hypothetical protein